MKAKATRLLRSRGASAHSGYSHAVRFKGPATPLIAGPDGVRVTPAAGADARQEMLARLLWRLRHDRSGVNRLKFAWKILRLRQVSLSDERILENFRTFSVGRPVGYP